MGRSIVTEIKIAASPEKVWATLTDFSSFTSWNPFLVKATAPVLEEGKRIEISAKPVGHNPSDFKPVLLKVDPQKELRWRGSLPIPGLFVGEHYFVLEPTAEGGTRLVHGENFTGLLVPLVGGMLADTEEGFKLMNTALKERCEKQ